MDSDEGRGFVPQAPQPRSQSPSIRGMDSDEEERRAQQLRAEGLNPLRFGVWILTKEVLRVGGGVRPVSIPFDSGYGF